MSGQLNEGALVTYALDEIIETFEVLDTFTSMAQLYNPPGAEMQRSANSWFKPIEQQSRSIDGWDITGQEGGVLELSVGGSLGVPSNTFFKLRADDMRDERSYRRKIRANALRLAGEVEERGLQKAVTQGSFMVANSNDIGSTAFNGWDALAATETKMFDLEYAKMKGMYAYMNATDYKAAGRELTQSTANYQGQIPSDAYEKGRLQNQVAGVSEVYRHNKLPVLEGQSATLTVNGAQTFKPVATVPNATGDVPADNRFADLTVTGTTTGVKPGDKFDIAGMFAVSRDGKITNSELLTFTVVVVTGQVLTISPRPYAWDERPTSLGGSDVLTIDEAAYANVLTAFSNLDSLNFLNTTTGKTNVIMTEDSMVLASSPIPTSSDLFSGMKTEAFTAGKINGIIGWQGRLGSLDGSTRIAIWYDWQVEKPEEVGVFMGGQS